VRSRPETPRGSRDSLPTPLRRWQRLWLAALALSCAACPDRGVVALSPPVSGWPSEPRHLQPDLTKLDLLFVVDNSRSMADAQLRLFAQIESFVRDLRSPLCADSDALSNGRNCDFVSRDETLVSRGFTDIHVGVISTDLGTPGSMVPGCDDASRGDHGLLNPIRNGFAQRAHLPWAPRRPDAVTAPAGFRPMACNNDPDQFPSFITFCSNGPNTADMTCDVSGMNASTRHPATFSDWFVCNAGLFVNGCGLEQPLEAAWRALIFHDASDRTDNSSPNAGFLRADALHAIIVITDEEDGSARNCDYDEGFSATRGGAACADAKSVYAQSSASWSHEFNLDQRFYRYAPGGPQDPTWSLDRYLDRRSSSSARRWERDFDSISPGHPERLVFAAITGVPLATATRDGRTDWTALLGAPSSRGPDDYDGRDSSASIAGVQPSNGPFSMRAANVDPACEHVVPACRLEGSTYDPGSPCANAQSMAFPARRIVELARRFDELPRCNGAPCRNGLVSSICAQSFAPAFDALARRLRERAVTGCLAPSVPMRTALDGRRFVDCQLLEAQPASVQDCDAARGRVLPASPEDRRYVDENGVGRRQCVVVQRGRIGGLTEDGPGWSFAPAREPSASCAGHIRFAPGSTPLPSTITRLECARR